MDAAGEVKALVTDPKLVEERRGQIVRAAVKLFSEEGFYTTTIQQIAREAGVSSGLIYQYFRDKDDILFLALKLVLDTYEHEIPPQIARAEHPVARLCMAVRAYCEIVDGLREATVLAYRSTKSLRADRRVLIKDAETRTNRLIEQCLGECIDGGFMEAVNVHLVSYQMVMFAHAWALKHWALRERYTLARYVSEGIALLVEPFLTAKGRRALASADLGTKARSPGRLRPPRAPARAGARAASGRRAGPKAKPRKDG